VGTAGPTLVQHLDDIGAAVDAGGVAVRTLKHVDDVELTVKDIEPGHTTPFHLTGRQLPLAAGDVFSIAPDEPHAIGSDSPDALRLVCLDCFLADPAT
jgi:AraC-like ligand binding domain